MNFKAILIAAGAVICASFLIVFAVRSMAAQNIGRYVVIDGSPMVLYDSTTGQCWLGLDDDNDEMAWRPYVRRFQSERQRKPRKDSIDMPTPNPVEIRPAR